MLEKYLIVNKISFSYIFDNMCKLLLWQISVVNQNLKKYLCNICNNIC